MCPPVSHAAADGIPSTGVPPALEAILREQFAVLSNSIAIMQTISALPAVTTQTTKWTQEQYGRSIEINKTLANLRANALALQSASVSSVETKNATSGWPLPKIAGSASSSSNGRPSQNRTPGESVGISQPSGKRQKPFFSPAQKAPEEWSNKTKNSFAVLFSSGSHVVRTRTLSKIFARTPVLAWRIPTRSNAREAVTLPALFFRSKEACQQFLAAFSDSGFRYFTDNPWAVRKSADGFVRQARVFDERQMIELLPPPPLGGTAKQLITNHFQVHLRNRSSTCC